MERCFRRGTIESGSKLVGRSSRDGASRHRSAVARIVYCLGVAVLAACSGTATGPTTGPTVNPPVVGDCGFSVAETQTSRTVDAAGGPVNISVTADALCRWTVEL